MSITWDHALAWRMQRQLLEPVGDESVADVVRKLGAVLSMGEHVVLTRHGKPFVALISADEFSLLTASRSFNATTSPSEAATSSPAQTYPPPIAATYAPPSAPSR